MVWLRMKLLVASAPAVHRVSVPCPDAVFLSASLIMRRALLFKLLPGREFFRIIGREPMRSGEQASCRVEALRIPVRRYIVEKLNRALGEEPPSACTAVFVFVFHRRKADDAFRARL